MIINDNSKVIPIDGITTNEEQRIIDFLQGAVYCWCKNRKDEWFALRDLMGGENYYWKGTPLMILYEKNENINGDTAEEAAAKDAGWILKKMISNDKREFETKKDFQTRKYKWNGKENNEQ